ncbi:MAG: arsenite efflux transporter metallochaperone ArsD [Sporomusaceae bacterium]|nr:arsenite efflux transporter metallochaperone ArsD [Sporomusaceae bacterium]
MKKIQIFEPAMCCPTGLCGVGADPELLRISAVFSTLKKNGIEIDRFNLTAAPMEFINNAAVNQFIQTYDVEHLPLTVVDGKIIITGRYPTNAEFIEILQIPQSFLGEPSQAETDTPKKEADCGCAGGKCC